MLDRRGLNRVSGVIVDASMEVHSRLGPGLLEQSYEVCLAHELGLRGLATKRQLGLPIEYKGTRLDVGYRIDLLVEGSVLVEVKAVTKLHPVHEAQLLSYLKLGEFRLGLLINFHEERLRQGIRRLVNRF